ncbi:hypothetical protein TRFO_42041 [Tritrichomonas foetus]|uniref:SUN domain-containing protein n=1 Tax=Tritrichomonas foetus TaxID=1144522 RepID=A0A1J4L2B0_9EUKA|nr:hypothetical protein TRFO_42041 [Tritrichomonas foetus]|eukprot:OHT16092.1 hypothetical protein TRFO_42041 [Tritrichomonas foetus]
MIQKEISFISKHFYEIINKEDESENEVEIKRRKEKFISLGIDIIEMILQNENLKLYDEDSLFDFILKILEKKDIFSKSIHLLEYVKFECLSHESIEKFISIFDLEYINKKIWVSICQRLLITPNSEFIQRKDQNQNRYAINRIVIPFKNTINEGLFNYLRQKCSSNPHDFGLIEVTSSSVFSSSSSFQPKNTINPLDNNNNYFHSMKAPNEWICYQFKDFRFKLSKYQIRTFDGDQNYGHLKNWVLEISKDGQSWQVIDRQINCSLLNGPKKHSTFDIKSTTKFVNFIRLRQIDQNWGGNHYLVINSIEFYGEYLESIPS